MKVTDNLVLCPGWTVLDVALASPGPVISSEWVVWPLFCTTKTYFPGLKELFESLMWKSVSTALTVMAFEAAAAGPAVKTEAAVVTPANAASAATMRVATRLAACSVAVVRVACVAVPCGRWCHGLTAVGYGPDGVRDCAAGGLARACRP